MNMNEILIAFAAGFSAMVVAGWLANLLLARRSNTPDKMERHRRQMKKLSALLVRLVFGALGLGLVWTVYFLVLGFADKSQSQYAADSATLIVSVLTVLSIGIAFFEFLMRGKKD